MVQKIKSWWENNTIKGIAIIVGAAIVVGGFSGFVVAREQGAKQSEEIKTLQEQVATKVDYSVYNPIIQDLNNDLDDLKEGQNVISENQILIYSQLGEISGFLKQQDIFNGAKKIKVKK